MGVRTVESCRTARLVLEIIQRQRLPRKGGLAALLEITRNRACRVGIGRVGLVPIGGAQQERVTAGRQVDLHGRVVLRDVLQPLLRRSGRDVVVDDMSRLAVDGVINEPGVSIGGRHRNGDGRRLRCDETALERVVARINEGTSASIEMIL